MAYYAKERRIPTTLEHHDYPLDQPESTISLVFLPFVVRSTRPATTRYNPRGTHGRTRGATGVGSI